MMSLCSGLIKCRRRRHPAEAGAIQGECVQAPVEISRRLKIQPGFEIADQ